LILSNGGGARRIESLRGHFRSATAWAWPRSSRSPSSPRSAPTWRGTPWAGGGVRGCWTCSGRTYPGPEPWSSAPGRPSGVISGAFQLGARFLPELNPIAAGMGRAPPDRACFTSSAGAPWALWHGPAGGPAADISWALPSRRQHLDWASISSSFSSRPSRGISSFTGLAVGLPIGW